MAGEKLRSVGRTENERYWCLENLQEVNSIPSINPINLNYYGREQCEPGYTYGPHVRTNYILHMVIGGKGVLIKGAKTYPVCSGQAFLIIPGEETTYCADRKDPWHYMWVGFHGLRCEEMMQRAGFSADHPVLTCRNMDQIRKKMDELMQYAQLNYVNELLRLGTMYHLLALITENASQDLPELPGENSDGQLYIKSAVNLLINSGKRNIRVEDVAHAIGISRSYFTSIFRREMKVSPQEFLMNFRMERARGLLRYTDRPVGEIAEEVGYADSMSFSKAFKKRFHLTPSEFRNSKMNFVSKTEKGEFTEGLL